MPILDSEGKLFGRLNVFDAVVIAGLAALAGGIIMTRIMPDRAERRIHKMPTAVTCSVDLLLPGEDAWLARIAAPGDLQADPEKHYRAEIVAISEEQVPGRGDAVLVNLRIEAQRDSFGVVRYGRWPIRIGGPLFLTTTNYHMRGTVYRLEVETP
jgi:hypothetical protein